MNQPPLIGTALSHEKSLIEPLSTTLSVEDLHDLLEVMVVDAHNARVVAKFEAARRRRES